MMWSLRLSPLPGEPADGLCPSLEGPGPVADARVGPAEERVAADCGPVGLTAGELIDSARRCLNHWIAHAR